MTTPQQTPETTPSADPLINKLVFVPPTEFAWMGGAYDTHHIMRLGIVRAIEGVNAVVQLMTPPMIQIMCYYPTDQIELYTDDDDSVADLEDGAV